ncbi:(d)CMP kinase [Candidatus Purcelliella pentastirinorum]|uniref:(d)CMP kinase n=1 Tax=Candidatus Purcelliella pentastirinorum TaxID=472834 RepID=UPI002367FB3E|nr:(d)CMP kinase [Candidatus Purcelliella pentastirinorum]WDI78808.1 (d)CMP kinase [Candidatus Purcelliella pentastirinorum]WDR79941.1 (d)CMP kinase [Candidatus Purcelliella pentastirinorum]
MINKFVPVITIDGPSASGKSTICKIVSKILGWNILSSGLIYRSFAFFLKKNKIEKYIYQDYNLLIRYLNIFIYKDVFFYFLKDNNIFNQIYTSEIDNIASKLSVYYFVRKLLLPYHYFFRKLPGLVADGRDMGTMVFPNANIKIFIDSNINIRVKRRMLQLQKNNIYVSFNSLKYLIKDRDDRDCNRFYAPLYCSNDMFIIDSTLLSIEQVIDNVMQYVYKKLH